MSKVFALILVYPLFDFNAIWTRRYCQFCERFLMVRALKKYWPIRGSFWNKKHMNPKMQRDSENTIQESFLFLLINLWILLYIIASTWFIDLSTLLHMSRFMCGVVIGFNSVACLLMCCYNYIRANHCLQILLRASKVAANHLPVGFPMPICPEMNAEESKFKDWAANYKGAFRIFSCMHANKKIFTVEFLKESFSPWLSSSTDVIEYVTHLDNTLGQDVMKIQHLLWTDQLDPRAIFRQWERERHPQANRSMCLSPQ
jgi:hypothetical protein